MCECFIGPGNVVAVKNFTAFRTVLLSYPRQIVCTCERLDVGIVRLHWWVLDRIAAGVLLNAVYFLDNFVFCLHKVELLTFLNHAHKCSKHRRVLGVAPFLVLTDLVEKVRLPFDLLCEIVSEILIFGFFIKFLHLRFLDHSIQLLGIRICYFYCLYHFRKDYLAKFQLSQISKP